ncbi:UDP-N-acetylenolpyruvoylglucosamine reductase [Candidatus Westeberhardia cardiocondylae]|uniref:UDP-N-acetylenolpyruvoylglucosamine reductase n=1 Tax=Candidatus Westeberhardia cardiocondylae TaxID=1594731 RepID=A0A0H5BWF5_9ENTR|nr:UDP-N-acetylmuramate dehydrogenase [Candidatus Westeberhardia cardiocondylae]CEN32000.1 UDP-N-acetylenolpyruvoylglucosamine reductase [Candidatus Westeberhardia cardiocondylae]
MYKIQSLNTFSINALAKNVVTANSELELFKLWNETKKNKQFSLILGKGSNILFLENFLGTIILNRIKGIIIREKKTSWNIHSNSGETWHNLVKHTIYNNIPGLENMALIPGCVGSAPIQNIGAYGIEFHEICQYIDIIELKTGKKIRLNAYKCKFGYRTSIFQKNNFTKKYAITAVGIRLKKNWKPILTHNELKKHLNKKTITPKNIYNTICKIRKNKFPNLLSLGNAGSFFKNPIINKKLAQAIIKKHPNIPYYIQKNKKIKFLAAWIIENCGLKGFRLKNAAVYKKHASILVNTGNADGKNIIELAKYIQRKVKKKFSLKLKLEVQLIYNYKKNNIFI